MDKLEIVSARYEALHHPDPACTRYVTLQIRALVVQDTKLMMKNEFNLYFGDPDPGKPKQLVIMFKVGLRQVEMKWIEGGSFVNVHSGDFGLRKTSAVSTTVGFGSRTYGTVGFPHEALPVIMSFLPVFPDRLSSVLVCREWSHSLSNTGLTEEFRVGYLGEANSYVNQPCSFVSLIVSKSQSSLRILDLAGYDKLNDDTLVELLGMNLARLAVLDLTDCVELTDKSVVEISTRLPNLKMLTLKRLRQLTDASLVPIISNLTWLERLDLSELRNLTNQTAERLANMTHLKALFLRENHGITNQGMRGFFTNEANELEELSLWGLHRLTLSPSSSIRFAMLRSLNLEGCIAMDDDAVEVLAEACSNGLLLALSLKYCHKLSDRSVQTIARRMPNLQHLNLAYVCRMTDLGLESITALLSDLRSIDLSHCFKLSEQAISSVAAGLSMLSELKLRAFH
ncbi:hypothetical protein BASA81_009079 [Batrachochytrium salamandrivorans]|nr:hypothetical protein BASA81_009079 [Batrachochytrium salamandrivorans]